MLQHALALAKRGRYVFPCRPRDKTPATPHGCKDATTDPDIIRRWWQQESKLNIGIACGEASGIFVVDIDGDDGEAALRQIEEQNTALPPTVEAITARGRHLYFQWPGRPVPNSAGKIAPGIDTRGDGGYVLAPPSMHPSGRRYAWSVDTARILATAPEWLLARIAAPANGIPAATPPTEWRELVQGVAEGARNCSIARLAGYLLRHRIDPFVTIELLRNWNTARCAPPLPEGDIVRIVDSIAAKELKRRGLT
jgi:hypothetical protein